MKFFKKYPVLYQIHLWILKVQDEGWGEIEFTIKSHNYQAKTINMKATKPKKKNLKSLSKRILVDKSGIKG